MAGAQHDQELSPDEWLYMRFRADQFSGTRLIPTAIRCPDQSVNCASKSQPKDVLKPNFYDHGIATFRVAEVPQRLSTPEKESTYDFIVEPDPIPANDAHCEIRAYKDGERRHEVARTVKQEFRVQLANRITIHQLPRASS